MSKLFSPLTVKNITLKNRIVMSPMCQYSAKDGYSNDWHLAHYGSRAVGGVGLIIQEATAIAPEGRITSGDLGIWSDDHIPGLKKIVDFIHQHAAVAGIQLAHAGRKASCAVPWEGGKQLDSGSGGWQTVAPSNRPFSSGERLPEALDKNGIENVISSFRSAAVRALNAGYKVIEIHSAHGYLVQEFLSPLSNHRKDEYGGSFENRTRLLRQVVDAINSVWPAENPLFVRISSTEWTEGGWSLEESVKLGYVLKGMGVDLIDCSSGGNIFDAKIPFVPGYQVPFSEEVRKSAILTGAVGLITSASQAEKILQEEKADIVFLGRELLRNPYFALHAAKELGEEIAWPSQYLRSK
ncbi:MAG TPA: NADPH dehydrogenase NamA [Bacteroidales bacterium]|nr:NADPH dehydrogenase NamA [Bacteroidales bacterium]